MRRGELGVGLRRLRVELVGQFDVARVARVDGVVEEVHGVPLDKLHRPVEGGERLLPLALPAVEVSDRHDRVEHGVVEFVRLLVGGDRRSEVLKSLVGGGQVEVQAARIRRQLNQLEVFGHRGSEVTVQKGGLSDLARRVEAVGLRLAQHSLRQGIQGFVDHVRRTPDTSAPGYRPGGTLPCRWS